MKIFTLSASAGAIAIALSVPAFAQAQGTDTTADEDLVIVTGSPLARDLDDTLVGTSVLADEELRRVEDTTIGETLRREPGVATSFFGAGASRPIIRGQDGDRIRVLDNGIGSIDASSASPDHAVAVPPALAQRIEIIRGTSILRYGSSGSGGVVDVRDGRLPDEVPEGGADGAIRLGASTVDDGVDGAAGLTARIGSFGGLDVVGHVSGSFRDAENYDIPGFAESAALRAEEEAEEEGEEDEDHEEEEVRDTLENSYVEAESLAAGLSFIGDRGFLAIGVKSNKTTYGIPGGHGHGHGHDEEEEGEEEEGEEHGEEGGVFIDLDQDRLDLNGRLDFGTGPFEALQLFAGIADYTHTEFEGPGEPGTVFTNEGYEARIEALHRPNGTWRGATGVQFRNRDFSAIGEEAFVPPSETDQYGIYTFHEVRPGAWLFDGALRYENTEQTNSVLGIDRTFDGWSVSGGAGYDFSDTMFGGITVFRTERAPTTEELFSDGPHLATGQFEIGDSDLDTEIAVGIEAVWRLRTDAFDLTANVFHTAYEDFIYGEDLGLTGADILIARGEDDEEELEEFGELDAFQFTAEDATFTGFEIEAETRLGRAGGFDVSADAVLDYVEAELDDGGPLPRIPPLGATIGLEAESARFFLRGEVEYAGEQDDVAEFERPTDDYTLVNLYADWKPVSDMDVTLSLALLNATDEEARNHSSFLKDSVPLPGRNLRMAVRYGF